MTLQEAIRSGRRFTRPAIKTSYGWLQVEGTMICIEPGTEFRLDTFDILATDWEFAPKAKLLSAEDLRAAAKRYNSDVSMPGYWIEGSIEGLIKKLGLE